MEDKSKVEGEKKKMKGGLRGGVREGSFLKERRLFLLIESLIN